MGITYWEQQNCSTRYLNLFGNLGIVKEKPTRKTCFSREKKRLATHIYPAKFCMAAFL